MLNCCQRDVRLSVIRLYLASYLVMFRIKGKGGWIFVAIKCTLDNGEQLELEEVGVGGVTRSFCDMAIA